MGVVLCTVLGSVAAPHARADVTGTLVDAGGLHVLSVTQIDARQMNVSVSSEALGRAVDVRILVPSGYETSDQRWPVLYLFHGTSGRASDWVTNGEAEQATDG